MSKYNDIQNEILKLSGGRFQKLAEALLREMGYKHFNTIGSVYGKDKTRTGTPDTLVTLPNGNYLFAEFTTKESNLFEKLKYDIEKCFDEGKTGISRDQIEKIFLCYTDRLSTDEQNQLNELCKKQDVSLELYNLETISLSLYTNYPRLAHDFLGVQIDTGQIVRPNEFIQLYNNNKLATPIDLNLHFREEEMEKAIEYLEVDDLLILTGSAGVGKTRLALEICKTYQDQNPEFETWCIFKRSVELWEDLKSYFSRSGKFIILVDDANRISRFEYIVDLLLHQRDDQEIRVVATVRDYASQKVRDEAFPLSGFHELKLNPFTDEQIKEIVKEEYHITYHHALQRIVEVSSGNPRLAIMAAALAKEENSLLAINDVSNLYDKYFKSIREELFDKGNRVDSELNLKVAAIISFFKAVDRTNEEMMKEIETAFGISSGEFWEAAIKLHEQEFVDMYEQIAVRIADQVLATYLFYLCFFKEGLIDFSVLIRHLFPRFRGRIVDSLSPVLSAFDYNSITEMLKPEISSLVGQHRSNGETQKILELLNTFWFVDQTETLIFAKKRIDELEEESYEIAEVDFSYDQNSPRSDSILALLRPFANNKKENAQIALELVLEYARKCPSDVPGALRVLIRDYGFSPSSDLQDYAIQHMVADTVWEKTSEGNDLFVNMFLAVSGEYLKTQFETSQMKSNRTLQIIRFYVPLTPTIKNLRSNLWQRIFELHQKHQLKDELTKLIRSYCEPYLVFDDQKKIIEYDSSYLLPHLINTFDEAEYRDSVIIHNYLDLLDRFDITYDETLREQFNNKIFELSDLLLSEWGDRESEKYSFEEYREVKRKQIKKFIKDYQFNDFVHFFEACKELKESPDQRKGDYLLSQRIGLVLFVLAESAPELYKRILGYYLSIKDPFKVHGYRLVEVLTERESWEEVVNFLNSYEFSTKGRWLFFVFETLPVRKVSPEALIQLYTLYEEAKPDELPHDWNFLQKYEPLDSKVVSTVLEVLVEKSEEDSKFVSSMEMLVMNYKGIEELIKKATRENFDLIKRAYFFVSRKENHADYKGKFFNLLLDRDANFISEYIDWLYKNEKEGYLSGRSDKRNFSFLWERDDYEKIIQKALERIYSNEQNRVTFWHTNLEMIFDANYRKDASEAIQDLQLKFLKNQISNRHSDIEYIRFLFQVISKFPANKRCELIECFISKNLKFEDFKTLPLHSNSGAFTGSYVPVLDGQKEFYESLLPFMNKPELLSHRKFIEEKVEGLKRAITKEKKRDFLED